jgi:tRNA (guanine9-N1)-methyltransferase
MSAAPDPDRESSGSVGSDSGDDGESRHSDAGGADAPGATVHRRTRREYTEEERVAFWARKKRERRTRLRERNRGVQAERQSEWEALSAAEQEARRAEAVERHERKRREAAEREARTSARLADPAVPSLVFDLQFTRRTPLRDIKSAVSQLKISYSAMRRDEFALRPVFASGGSGADAAAPAPDGAASAAPAPEGDAIFADLRAYEGFHKFPPAFIDASVAALPRESTVYLTADSETVLWDLVPGERYVIGAFVDHNQMKGATAGFARAHGMRTARLPLDESITVGNRCKVLAINHVVDVLLAFARHRDWRRAMLDSLPSRREPGAAPGDHAAGAASAPAAAGASEAPARRDRDDDDGQ